MLPIRSYDPPSQEVQKFLLPVLFSLVVQDKFPVYVEAGWLADCHPDGRAKKGSQIGKSLGKGGGREDGGKSFARRKEIHTN